jgi:hypothetical protein
MDVLVKPCREAGGRGERLSRQRNDPPRLPRGGARPEAQYGDLAGAACCAIMPSLSALGTEHLAEAGGRLCSASKTAKAQPWADTSEKRLTASHADRRRSADFAALSRQPSHGAGTLVRAPRIEIIAFLPDSGTRFLADRVKSRVERISLRRMARESPKGPSPARPSSHSRARRTRRCRSYNRYPRDYFAFKFRLVRWYGREQITRARQAAEALFTRKPDCHRTARFRSFDGRPAQCTGQTGSTLAGDNTRLSRVRNPVITGSDRTSSRMSRPAQRQGVQSMRPWSPPRSNGRICPEADLQTGSAVGS